MTILELLTEKGFVEGVDFSFDGVTLAGLEKTRQVEQIIHHEAVEPVYGAEGDIVEPGQEAYDEIVLVDEIYTVELPDLLDLKRECLQNVDTALVISQYLAGKNLGEDDSINIDLFLKGGPGWRSESVPAPSIEELYDLIPQSESKIAQEKTNAEAQKFLDESDWKVLRHRDQQEMGLATSLTGEEFQALLQQRQMAREAIIR